MSNAARVLVTGGTGYVGRYVVATLLRERCSVVALVLPGRSEFCLSALAELGVDTAGLEIVESDLASTPEDTAEMCLAVGACPDAVIHLAWRDGFKHNAKSHMADLSAHYRFLCTLSEFGVEQISVLGTMHEVGYWEGGIAADSPTNPISQYGIAKEALRRALTAQLAGASTLRWLRCYYITGDDRRNNSIFARILEAVDAGKTTFPFTSGKNLYDFIDVAELAEQICAAALSDSLSGVLNCASGVPLSLADKVEQFIRELRLPITLEYGAFPDRPYDSPGVWANAEETIPALLAASQRDARVKNV